MNIPYYTFYFLPGNVAYEGQHSLLHDQTMFTPLRQEDKHFRIYRNLCICHNKVYLPQEPTVQNGKKQPKANCHPSGNWCISFKIIHNQFFLTVIQIQTGFVFGHLIDNQIPFSANTPHIWNKFHSLWNFSAWNQLPLSIIYMPITSLTIALANSQESVWFIAWWSYITSPLSAIEAKGCLILSCILR